MNYLFDPVAMLVIYAAVLAIIVFLGWLLFAKRSKRDEKIELSSSGKGAGLRLAAFSASSLLVFGGGLGVASLFFVKTSINDVPPGADLVPVQLDKDGNPIVVARAYETGRGDIIGKLHNIESYVQIDYVKGNGEQYGASHVAKLKGDVGYDVSIPFFPLTPVSANDEVERINVRTAFWARKIPSPDGSSRMTLLTETSVTHLPDYSIEEIELSREDDDDNLAISLELEPRPAMTVTGSQLATGLKAIVTVWQLNKYGDAQNGWQSAPLKITYVATTSPLKFTVDPIADVGLETDRRWHVFLQLIPQYAEDNAVMASHAVDKVLPAN